MKLYGSLTSPFVRHVRIALAQSDLAWEFSEADPAMSQERSPTAKVPFMEDGDVLLTDSSSILKYVREKSGAGFLVDIEDYELFAMTNTLLDSALNLFFLEQAGVTPDQVPYLARQRDRVISGAAELNRRFDPAAGIVRDSALRCACFLGWTQFRQRLSLDGLDNLQGLLAAANENALFAETAPPQ